MSSERVQAARTLLRALNGLGSRRAEWVWASLSGAAGTLFRAPTRRWTSSGDERVLVIAPHPDDEAVGCAGTLIRHHERGDLVRILFMTDGSRSRAFGFDVDSMRRLRQAEGARAAARMGADCNWVGLREGDWSNEEGRSAIVRAFREINPTVVYAPSLIDFHPEHRRIAKILGTSLSEAVAEPEVRIYGAQVPLTPQLTNLVHDVSDLETAIASVFASYPSQSQSTMPMMRLRRYAARFYGAATQVEGFCAVQASTYASLQRRPPARFKALSGRAWTDPLVLIVGLAERRAWGRAAHAQQPQAANPTSPPPDTSPARLS